MLVRQLHGQQQQWRMAEFHDAGGWKLWGLGDTMPWADSTTPGRFWVAINHQPD